MNQIHEPGHFVAVVEGGREKSDFFFRLLAGKWHSDGEIDGDGE